MRILMLVNWKVLQCSSKPDDKQPPDYYISGEPYWFFKYFQNNVEVDVVDIHTIPFIEKVEKTILRFYILQTLKILPRLKNYDLILSHGMQSGIVISLIRKVFGLKYPKHVVFDIGSFNSAKENGWMLRLMQFSSRSIDGLIYHTSKQLEYYKRYYPWLTDKSQFIRFGTDIDYFHMEPGILNVNKEKYIICVGYIKRDWDTLIKAYEILDMDIKLILIGNGNIKVSSSQIQIMPYLPIRELMEYIQKASFCILPLEYRNYSFGQMTLLQQMAMKKAVITAKVPSVMDYVEDGVDALLYEPKNAIDLADKMKYLITHNDICRKISEQAYLSVRNRMNEREMADKIERFLFDSMI